MTQVQPKAFISHASEDKQRFVRAFATKLREQGVDAWLDEWEIKAGDSLVDKIFTSGIGKADVFIVVLSSVSVTKAWVREELDSGVVRRIEGACRLIPVLIDDCEVPHALRHIRWVRAHGDAVDDAVADIVATVFEQSAKPLLGSAPRHTSAEVVDFFPDLTRVDNLVFASVCREYMNVGHSWVEPGPVLTELGKLGIDTDQAAESLEILDELGMLHRERVIGGGIAMLKIEPHQADDFVRHSLKDYDRTSRDVAAAIVNQGARSSEDIVASTDHDLPIVNHLLAMLSDHGRIKVSELVGGGIRIYDVSASLRRLLN